jgi:hypothetical protein
MKHTDVWMIQARNGFGFPLKTLLANRIRGEMARKNFDGDCALQSSVARTVHLTHAARAYRRDDFVGPQPSSGCKGHFRSMGGLYSHVN